MAQPSAILFTLSGLGDTLFLLPALAAWRQREPERQISAFTMFPAVRDLLRASPLVDQVIHRDFLKESKATSVAYFHEFRSRPFDVSVIPYGSNRLEYNLAAWLTGAKLRLAHDYRLDRGWNLRQLNHGLLPQEPDRHAVEANGALLATAKLIDWAALPAPALDWIRLPEIARRRADEFLATVPLQNRLLVGVHPGTNTIKNQAQRGYPIARWAEALRKIAAQRPEVFFLLFGGPSDEDRLNELAQALPTDLARAVRPVDILACAALIDRCAFFLGNDNGPLHLAAFRGKPCVAVFGPTNPAYVHPWGVPHRVVHRELACRPCFDYSRRALHCPAWIDYACVKDLPAQQVAAAFDDLAREISSSVPGAAAKETPRPSRAKSPPPS